MSSSRAAWILPEAEDEAPKQEGSANHSADVKDKEDSQDKGTHRGSTA